MFIELISDQRIKLYMHWDTLSLRNQTTTQKNIYDDILYKTDNRFFDLPLKQIFGLKIDDYFMPVFNFLKNLK